MKTEKSREVLTAELVNKHYNKLRPVWEPFAKRAVDRAFRNTAINWGIKSWRPVKFKETYDKIYAKEYKQKAMDDLELGFWEQDVGWEGGEEAYEKMCKKMKMDPVVPDTADGSSDMLAAAGKWAAAWNRYQRAYARKTYGVDINFGN